ncbi:dihydropteroate synthase [Bacteroidota bacterium]
MFERDFPKVMGILNVTPDSFSDGGLYYSTKNAVKQGLKLIDDGADILDIGGKSTRPGASEVSEEEEINRVIPVIEEIKKTRPDISLSIDTTKFHVAKAAVDAGVGIINDVSGLDNDIRLAELAAKKNISIIIMHMKGTPRTMQQNPLYNDIIEDIFLVLKKKIEIAKEIGVKSVIADVGIGFGKTVEHNLKLLKYHDKFIELGIPLLAGLSRKSFIGKILDIEEPSERDIPTALIHALLLNKKFDIIRVHNLKLINMLKKIFLAFYEV